MNEERINASEQSEMFSLIGRTLKNKVECYAVGGTALMFLGLKETTKDVDLLFKKNEDYENLRKALHNLGAKESKTNIINPEKLCCPHVQSPSLHCICSHGAIVSKADYIFFGR